jgi:adenylate cyclase
MADQPARNPEVDENWRTYLVDGEIAGEAMPFGLTIRDFRGAMRLLPSSPRCMQCNTPFSGAGGWLVGTMFNQRRSKLNPHLCNICEEYISQHLGGAEVPLSMLFVDVRGSTTLAEGMSSGEFSQLINRFYNAATSVMVDHNALIEKIMGDEVTGLFVPGFAGPNHAQVAIHTAQLVLRAVGYTDPAGPWVPAGAGVHTGQAYVGAIGSKDGVTDIAALGDAVNTAARLASQAAPGEVVVSEAACAAAGPDACQGESRHLNLKGRTEPVDVRVLRVAPG